jgi:cyclin-dependent kinase
MVNGKPLFTGVSESDQLKKIFKIRGTPNDKLYPELKTLPDWNVCSNYFKKMFLFYFLLA